MEQGVELQLKRMSFLPNPTNLGRRIPREFGPTLRTSNAKIMQMRRRNLFGQILY